jgi:hypothetical protein
MKHRILWPAVGVLGLLALAFVIGSAYAQRIVGGGGAAGVGIGPFGPVPGRFMVAHASAEAVLILDTATGQVYKAVPKDFKKASELPKVEDGLRWPATKDRPVPKEREKEEGDERPRKERDKRDKEREGEGRRDRQDRD